MCYAFSALNAVPWSLLWKYSPRALHSACTLSREVMTSNSSYPQHPLHFRMLLTVAERSKVYDTKLFPPPKIVLLKMAQNENCRLKVRKGKREGNFIYLFFSVSSSAWSSWQPVACSHYLFPRGDYGGAGSGCFPEGPNFAICMRSDLEIWS